MWRCILSHTRTTSRIVHDSGSAGVIPLPDISPHAGALVGTKALNLARMMRAGFPVPPGFCISVVAYKEHVQRAALCDIVGVSLDAPALYAMRESIIGNPLSGELRDAIAAQYRAMKSERVAVRSSALLEDLPEKSFAGLYETFLEIEGFDACVTAVKRCWASLWTERACAYRERSGFAHQDVGMAVIVQNMVSAAASGVMFTSDPRTGRRDRIIIEAGAGLGVDLVSRKVTPERIVLSGKDGSVLSHLMASPETLPVISRRVARRLGKLGLKAEDLFQSPQDLEWAISGRKIFLLQSRPITALPVEPSWEDRQVWSNLNVGEVVPDVLSPMSFSFIKALLVALFKPICDLIDIDLDKTPLFDRIAGRLYFNVNTLVAIFTRMPGSSEGELEMFMGGQQGAVLHRDDLRMLTDDAIESRGSVMGSLLRLPGFVVHVVACRSAVAERFVRQMREENDSLRAQNVTSMSEAQLIRDTFSAIHAASNTWDISYNIPGFAGFGSLQKVCKRWLGDEDGALAGGLLAGSGGMEDAQAGTDLLNLAMFVHAHESVCSIVLAGEDWLTTCEKLKAVAEADEVLMLWDDFMRRHGHHARGEVEVANPRWSERPDYILSLVRGYVENLVRHGPHGSAKDLHRKRDECEQACRRRLRNPLKRFAFSYFLSLARRGLVLRENMKNEGVRYIAWLRNMLLEVGERLSRRGVLGERDDIFFLEIDELDPVAKGTFGSDCREAISTRRAEYRKWQSLTPPHVIVGRFDPEGFVEGAVDENARVLTGLGVSPGVVTGKARVILKLDATEQILPGEILVAPFADPGWVPYLVCAAGIVMDMGGLLSHGCIIAREYGIPTTVNVGSATKIIKTGQTIQVDGTRGVVRILK